nr:universal stress protein [uncultured Duganella sp.]
MSYKTILVHVDQSPHAAARIELAGRLARSHGAHLVGAALTGLTMEYYRNSGLASRSRCNNRRPIPASMSATRCCR